MKFIGKYFAGKKKIMRIDDVKKVHFKQSFKELTIKSLLIWAAENVPGFQEYLPDLTALKQEFRKKIVQILDNDCSGIYVTRSKKYNCNGRRMYSNKDRKLSIAWNGMEWVIDRTSKIKKFIQMRKKNFKSSINVESESTIPNKQSPLHSFWSDYVCIEVIGFY